MYDVNQMSKMIEEKTGTITRATILGHIQRGGKPVAMDRILATKMAICAIDSIANNKTGICIGYQEGQIKAIDIKDAFKIKRKQLKNVISLFNQINDIK
jgi:6-phosphofructokinase 1